MKANAMAVPNAPFEFLSHQWKIEHTPGHGAAPANPQSMSKWKSQQPTVIFGTIPTVQVFLMGPSPGLEPSANLGTVFPPAPFRSSRGHTCWNLSHNAAVHLHILQGVDKWRIESWLLAESTGWTTLSVSVIPRVNSLSPVWGCIKN